MGDFGMPVLGHSLEALDDYAGFFRSQYQKHGPVSWSGTFGRRTVLVMGPDAVSEVLTNADRAFANGPGWGHFLNPFFRRGVMLLDGEEHLRHKRVLQEAFTRHRLESYLDRMNGGIERGISDWRPQRDFRLYDATKKLLLDLATEVFVGADLGADSDRLTAAFIDTVAATTSIVRADLPGGSWHRGLRGRLLLEGYFREQIPTKRGGAGEDLFSVLCRAQTANNEQFTDEDVVNHMIFTLMAAHDTSTITTATLAYYLAKHQDWQDRLREESLALGKRALTYDDFDRLPLLDLAFREALRLNPPVGGLARETVKDTDILGHYVPANTLVFTSIYLTHRMPDWWERPDVFDPGRFSPGRRDHRMHRYQWSPFGGGVHKCIGLYLGGMQVKSIIHQMLLDFQWSVPPGYAPNWEIATGLFPGDGLPVWLCELAIANGKD